MSSARQSDDRRETSNRWREIAGHSRTPAIWAPLSAIADALMFLLNCFDSQCSTTSDGLAT